MGAGADERRGQAATGLGAVTASASQAVRTGAPDDGDEASPDAGAEVSPGDDAGTPAGPAAEQGGCKPSADSGTVDAVTDVLVKSLRALGDAGRPDHASRLAARAWWVLRGPWPRQAERVNGTMHYLARLPAEPGAAAGGPDRPETGRDAVGVAHRDSNDEPDTQEEQT